MSVYNDLAQRIRDWHDKYVISVNGEPVRISNLENAHDEEDEIFLAILQAVVDQACTEKGLRVLARRAIAMRSIGTRWFA